MDGGWDSWPWFVESAASWGYFLMVFVMGGIGLPEGIQLGLI